VFDVKDETPGSLGILLTSLAQHPHRSLTLGLHAPASVRHMRDGGWTRPVLGFVKSVDEEAFFEAGGNILRIWEWDAAPGRIAAHVARGRPIWITVGEGSTGRRVGDFEAEQLVRMMREGASGFLVNDPVEARLALEEGRDV
jgi:glycerophosphoryl diester phosphodiesterase